jgi:hypothetical protein
MPRSIFSLAILLIAVTTVNSKCCKRCEAGKPCGDYCIPSDSICESIHGCACKHHHDCSHECVHGQNKPCGNRCIGLEETCDKPHGTACYEIDHIAADAHLTDEVRGQMEKKAWTSHYKGDHHDHHYHDRYANSDDL